ncbi:hypothetical protein [Robiginitalea marina]|uniref:DUF2946 domain-containing protein n=1 Tax=Robiginitalea marina TaxID=2954105 RepID=A0ABT1ATK8_9FLAO|nr:hypothetical protein [Robiginitalea marina]MCO5723280.1 hypothetical protein [Robiginitalea marina]
MSTRWFHYFSSIFLLLAFLGAKSMESHGLLHADEENGPACEWCEYALVLESTPFHPPLAQAIEVRVEAPLPGHPAEAPLPALCPVHLEGALFCRPPPVYALELV